MSAREASPPSLGGKSGEARGFPASSKEARVALW